MQNRVHRLAAGRAVRRLRRDVKESRFYETRDFSESCTPLRDGDNFETSLLEECSRYGNVAFTSLRSTPRQRGL